MNELGARSGEVRYRNTPRFSSVSGGSEPGTMRGITPAGEHKHETGETASQILSNPAEQMRPVLTKGLLGMTRTFPDGFYVWQEISGEKVVISTYYTSLNRDYLQRYPDGAAGKERHSEALKEGWGSIRAEFEVTDRKTAVPDQVTSYVYNFVLPQELDTLWGGENLAAILGISRDTIMDAEEAALARGNPIRFAQELVAELKSSKIDVREVDLTKPVVIASTNFGDGSHTSEVLGEPSDENAHHYQRLQALYDELSREKDDS